MQVEKNPLLTRPQPSSGSAGLGCLVMLAGDLQPAATDSSCLPSSSQRASFATQQYLQVYGELFIHASHSTLMAVVSLSCGCQPDEGATVARAQATSMNMRHPPRGGHLSAPRIHEGGRHENTEAGAGDAKQAVGARVLGRI